MLYSPGEFKLDPELNILEAVFALKVAKCYENDRKKTKTWMFGQLFLQRIEIYSHFT